MLIPKWCEELSKLAGALTYIRMTLFTELLPGVKAALAGRLYLSRSVMGLGDVT